MGLKLKDLRAAKPGEWISDGPAGSGRGSGVLLFRRTPGGVLAYFRSTRADGSRDTLSIGQYDEDGRGGMTLSEAREKAGELSRLYQSGVRDVRAHIEGDAAARAAVQKAEQEAQMQAAKERDERGRYTLRALCESYAAHLAKQGKVKSSKEAASAFKCHVFTHEAIASTPAREVTSDHVALMVRRVIEAGHQRMAGVVRSYLSASFNCAKGARYDSRLPAGLIPFAVEHNPVDVVPAIAVKAGNRTLNAPELRAYLGHLGGGSMADRALLVALLAGGQRMAQLLRATASDWDADTGSLRLWDGKGRRRDAREHILPLAGRAAALVAGLAANAGEGRMFGTTVETTVSKRVAEIAASMKGEPFDLRDIRRTVETMLAGMGISRDVRAQLLSHGISGVQATHYDRHTYTDEKRAALVAWEARIAAPESGTAGAGNVRAMRRRAA